MQDKINNLRIQKDAILPILKERYKKFQDAYQVACILQEEYLTIKHQFEALNKEEKLLLLEQSKRTIKVTKVEIKKTPTKSAEHFAITALNNLPPELRRKILKKYQTL